ncbi:MAG: hypothetical protein KGJ86_11530, partial [Chloroflexota bacterium]|nr:hypothetical protein [Chloroflexota bacterium]
TAIVETDHPLQEIPPATIGPVERDLGRHAAALIPDGATIQFGIGNAPEAVLRSLHRHRDLGVHSGLLCDAFIDLVDSGAVTNQRKTVDRGLTIADLLLGTDRLFRFCSQHADVEFRSSDYVHDVRLMAAIEGFVAINSAIEVDLLGQANSETIQGRRVSGIGGLLDFVRGANASPGGQSILVLPSTGRGGSVSRIVPRLGAGVPVSIPAADNDWVVTEYGSAHVKGKTAAQRAGALISIAHPSFRDELTSAHGRLER